MRYIIHEIPPSLNRFAGRKNCWEYRKAKGYWTQLVKSACKQKPKTPYRKARVTISYYFDSNRRRDPDNYAGKFLLDGLTAAGVIADDSFGNIELALRGEVDKRNPRTEIEVEERANEAGEAGG